MTVPQAELEQPLSLGQNPSLAKSGSKRRSRIATLACPFLARERKSARLARHFRLVPNADKVRCSK